MNILFKFNNYNINHESKNSIFVWSYLLMFYFKTEV